MSANVISGKNEWFYSDAVKEHFFHPKNIFKTEDEKKRYKADGVGIVGSPACIDKTTIIHTNSDIKPIEELTNRNTVFSHDGTYNQISKSFRIKYSGILLKIKNSLGDVVLTPDHLIYAIKLPSKKYYMHTKYKKKFFPSWVHAGNLNKGDVCLYPIPLCLNHIKYVEIPIKKFKYDFRSKGLSSVEISNDFLKLCGYFVAEGNTRKDGKEMCFSFGIHEMKLAKDVERILKKLFNFLLKIKMKK